MLSIYSSGILSTQIQTWDLPFLSDTNKEIKHNSLSDKCQLPQFPYLKDENNDSCPFIFVFWGVN